MALRTRTIVILTTVVLFSCLGFFLHSSIGFDIKGHFDGIFVILDKAGKYVIKDDLYVGDAGQVVYSRNFNTTDAERHPVKPGMSRIDYTWDEKDGSGIFENHLSDGTVLFTSLGRLYADNHQRIQGLFVGGTLPANILANTRMAMNQSGMSFYNGTRWFHIWCNANEAIIAANGREMKEPEQWSFLGSRLLDRSTSSPVVASYHRTEINGVPLRMERTAYFVANEPYVVLNISFRNIGTRPVSFYYVYGDEPWVGDYGTARGNVGWVKDQLIQYETLVSPREHSYAGMYQYGNDAINEGHNFTKVANFLEWLGPNLPFRVSFTNYDGPLADPTGKTPVPLKSDVRFIDVNWRVSNLQPQQSYDVVLALGMARHNPATDRPAKPSIRLSRLATQQVTALLAQAGRHAVLSGLN